MQKSAKRLIGSLVVAALLGTLAWIDGTRLQETGEIMIGRERQTLEGTPALSFVVLTAAGALACLLYAARQALLIGRKRS